MKQIECFERGSINQLNPILSGFHAKKVLLVTGKNSYDQCPIRNAVETNLKDFITIRYCDFNVNPKVEDLIKGARLVADFNPDAIVAMGGGSVLDTAKALSFLPAYDEVTVIDVIKGVVEVADRKKRLILIPTTSGSGSEATHFAVAYIDKIKYSIVSTCLLPDAVILDPDFTDTLPKELTAITVFDAFCHAIESFWSVGATLESKRYAKESIEIILGVFDSLINAPSAVDRDKMMRASFLAGKAINISKTTAPHALSYALTQYFGIPHGLAAMLLFPAFFELNTNMNTVSLNSAIDFEEYDNRMHELKTLMGVVSSKDAASKISQMILAAGFKRRLRDYGINNSDIALLADSVNIERLNNNPVIMNREQLILLLKTVC